MLNELIHCYTTGPNSENTNIAGNDHMNHNPQRESQTTEKEIVHVFRVVDLKFIFTLIDGLVFSFFF